MQSTPRRRIARLMAVVPAALTMCLLPAPASADTSADPPFVGWTAVLPATAVEHQPTSLDDCVAGRPACVQKVIRDMERRFEPLAISCAHSAVFALAYLRTTEAFFRTAQTAGFYRDPAFVNHEDVAFADAYFGAYDDWAAGRREQVPPAWRIAFDAGAAKQVSGMGDLLLGMNAHVNRDLPFVLAAIGLVAPDGSSRKADHDKVNEMLNSVVAPLIPELAERFDPSIEQGQTPYGIGYTGTMQVLLAWREAAWRNAERLVAAPDEAARARVAAEIEQYAATTARGIVASSAYVAPFSSTSARDQHCAARAGAEE